MKNTVRLLVSAVLLYLYGYTRKQKALQARIHGKWKQEHGYLILRTNGVISWEKAGQKPLYGYYELCGKQKTGELKEAWIVNATILKQQVTLHALVDEQAMDLRKNEETYHFIRV